MTSRVYSKTVALGSVVEVTRNAGAATRVWYIRNLLGVGGPAHPIILMPNRNRPEGECSRISRIRTRRRPEWKHLREIREVLKIIKPPDEASRLSELVPGEQASSQKTPRIAVVV
jgi:hypothetical protein